MLTATQRLRTMRKSKRYPTVKNNEFSITMRDFTTENIDSNETLYPREDENVAPFIVGTAVEKLIFLNVGYRATNIKQEKFGAKVAFHHCLTGAKLLDGAKGKNKYLKDAEKRIKEIDNGENVTVNALQLSVYENFYRGGALHADDYDSLKEINDATISNVDSMVRYSMSALEQLGEDTNLFPISFYKDSFGKYVTAGDADLLTNNTLWDIKVHVKKVGKDSALQLLCYYQLGLNGSKTHKKYASLKYIGFINPRRMTVQRLSVNDINPNDLELMNKSVIGYQVE